MFFCTCPQVLALPTELTGPGSDRAPGYTSVRRGGRQGERAGPDVGVCACHMPQASQGEGSGGQQWGELIGLLGPPSTERPEGRVAEGTGPQGAAARATGEARSRQWPRSFVVDVSWPERGHQKGVRAESLQSYPALCHPTDCSPPGSSVHEILQARILEWVAMPSSRGSSPPRD